MNLREALSRVDVEVANEVFDDILATELPVQDIGSFMETEIARAYEQYPVFEAIKDRLKIIYPKLRESGISNEMFGGYLAGVIITGLVLAGYAEREIPDTFPAQE